MLKGSFALILALSTCGNQPRAVTPEDIVRHRLAPVRIVLVETGEDISEDAMISDLSSARVVYLGERHDRATDHSMQHRIFSELYHRDPSIAVGFEMFQTPFQNVIDDWSAGRIDETTLRRETEWDERWGFDFRLYRPILEFVRTRHIPAHALNAPQEITRTVGREGVAGLSEEQRAQLPVLDLSNVEHRALVTEALGEHGAAMSEERLEAMYTAQVIWDETMARSVRTALEADNAPPRLVVLAGDMHVRGGLGIPERANTEPYRIVLTADVGDSDRIDAILESSPPAATYLWIVDPLAEIE